MQPQGVKVNTISLMLGHPDPTTLLTPEFQAAVGRAMASPRVALSYGAEPGNVALIEYLTGKINREQGLALKADQMMIVAGSTHAVDMVARLYTRQGESVVVESPTYADTLHIFRDHGVELHGVPMDDGGMIVTEFEATLKRLAVGGNPAKVFYTIPTFHNPTGRTLAEDRRREIVRLAREYGVTIVEDDVYRDLAYDAPAPVSFFALAEGIDVLQIGSFSKTLAPGLRLGWVIGSADAIAGFVGCGTTQMGGGASPLSAQIVAEYAAPGDWERHVDGLRELYQMRRDTLLGALERFMPDGVSWTMPKGGFFVWVTLPPTVYGKDVKRRAAERGVALAAGEGYFIHAADGAHNLRLTYSFAPPEDIVRAVGILGEVIRELA